MRALRSTALAGAVFLSGFPACASAQSAFPTAAGGMMVPGTALLVPNGQGGAGAGPVVAPVSPSNPLAVACVSGCNTGTVAVSGTVAPAPASGPAGASGCIVGTSSAQCAAAVAGRRLLAIDNESPTATIACAFGNMTPALNTAGSWTIPPQSVRDWSGSYVPNDAVNCVASAAGTPVTIEAN
jgi:Zn-dependent alcohol dehydrogenase